MKKIACLLVLLSYGGSACAMEGNWLDTLTTGLGKFADGVKEKVGSATKAVGDAMEDALGVAVDDSIFRNLGDEFDAAANETDEAPTGGVPVDDGSGAPKKGSTSAPDASQPFNRDAFLAQAQELVKKEGPFKFIEEGPFKLIQAIHKGDFPAEVYDLNLDDMTIEVVLTSTQCQGVHKGKALGDEAETHTWTQQVNLGQALDGLFDIITDEKEQAVLTKVQKQFYLRGRNPKFIEIVTMLAQNNGLSELAAALKDFPEAVMAINPYEDIWITDPVYGEKSLGYIIDRLLEEDSTNKEAGALKAAYGDARWKACFDKACAAAGIDVALAAAATEDTLIALIKELITTKRLKHAYLNNIIPDAVYDINIDEIDIEIDGNTMTIGALLDMYVSKNDAIAYEFAHKFTFRGRKPRVIALIKENTSKDDFIALNDEIDSIPGIIDHINPFSIELSDGTSVGDAVEQNKDTNTDAQAIIAKYGARWAMYKAAVWDEDAKLLSKCIDNAELTPEGSAILKARKDDPIIAHLVNPIVGMLPGSMDRELMEATPSEAVIKKFQSWIDGFEQAGIEFDGAKKVAYYKTELADALTKVDPQVEADKKVMNACVTNAELSAAAAGILKARQHEPHMTPYVTTFKADLPSLIEAELKKKPADEHSIKKLQTWLAGLEDAGIDFAGTLKVADYQKSLADALAAIAASKESGTSKGSWFTAKNILIAGGLGLACAYGYDRYRKSHQRETVAAEAA